MSQWRARKASEAQATSGTRTPIPVEIGHSVRTPQLSSWRARFSRDEALQARMPIVGGAQLDFPVDVEFDFVRQIAQRRVVNDLGPAQGQSFARGQGSHRCQVLIKSVDEPRLRCSWLPWLRPRVPCALPPVLYACAAVHDRWPTRKNGMRPLYPGEILREQ